MGGRCIGCDGCCRAVERGSGKGSRGRRGDERRGSESKNWSASAKVSKKSSASARGFAAGVRGEGSGESFHGAMFEAWDMGYCGEHAVE